MHFLSYCSYKAAEKHFTEALCRVRPQKTSMVPERWEPLLNNMGHCCRKLKKYDEALQYHHEVKLYNAYHSDI